MGVSQFKQPPQSTARPQPGPQPPQARPQQPAPRWEIGIDRSKVAAFIGVALIGGFGFGYMAARYLAGARALTEKAGTSQAQGPSVDSRESAAMTAPAIGPAEFHRVTRIVRPDTIEAEGAGGIRLIGVNPPAASSGDTTAFNKAMKFATETLLGKDVRIELEPSLAASGNKDETGNTLAYVYGKDGSLFNDEIIRQGNAFAKLDQPSKLQEQFRAAEREAIEKTRGVWASAARGYKADQSSVAASSGDKPNRRPNQPRLGDPIPTSIPATTLDARTGEAGATEPVIYVSSSDKMYHKPGCSYLAKKSHPMLLSEAKVAGYVACGRCFASTVLKAP